MLKHATWSDCDDFNTFVEEQKQKGIYIKPISIIPFKMTPTTEILRIFYTETIM
jgi:hypothetical protein